MPNRRLALTSYKRLVSKITALFEGVRRSLVEACWKTGQWIVEVEQQGAIKAAYGTGLLAKLSADLSKRSGPGFSERNLERMRAFYLIHPKSTAPSKLSWSQYSELIPVKNAAVRKQLEARALTEGLPHKTLRQLVQHELVREKVAENLTTPLENRKPPDLLPVPKLGLLNTYRIKDSNDTAWPDKTVLLLDHGFKGYRDLTPQESRGLKAGDIVKWTGAKLRKNGRTEKDLFTYRAYLEKVIDGDTFWVVLDIGTREISRQKLRLRGIDCPEINTKEGQAAKKFVESVLKDVPYLTVISSKNVTHDRYEADVFFTDKTGQETYLNNLLLEKGYAVRMTR
jgi:endonuclease YncB( thermonuclease family)